MHLPGHLLPTWYGSRAGAGVASALLLLLLACTAGGTGPRDPDPSPGPPPVTGTRLDCGGVGGAIRVRSVTIPERGTGGTLDAQLFAPDSTRQTAPCPALSLLPGGGAGLSSVEWAARRLAAAGYVVVVSLPSSGASTAAYDRAARSGIDFLASSANPYRAATDTGHVGVAGWSLGARALSITQEQDPRVDALVAWDNLAVSETGDDGSPLCTNQPATLRAPRVPALGQASEACSKGAEAKKAAYERWRAAGVPAMQVVFAGATHFLWSATAGTAAGHDLSHHYTQGWFDRWLKSDAAATGRLLARSLDGRAVDAVLSARYRSAAAFDGRACADLRADC